MTRPPKDEDTTPAANRANRDAEEGPNARSSFASPPCFMHELDAAYLGYFDRDELAARLGALLDEARALAEIAGDEARLCALLARDIARLKGMPDVGGETVPARTRAAGALDEKSNALDRARERLAGKIREILPRTADDGIHRRLCEMLAVYERRIARRRRPQG